MYCSVCGTKIDENASFCPNCGASVKIESKDVAATETVAEAVAPVVEEIKQEIPAVENNERVSEIVSETVETVNVSPVVEETPEPVVEPIPTPVVEPIPTPVVEPIPTPVVEPIPTPVVEETPTLVVEEIPTPVVEETPTPVVEPIPTPVVEPIPTPVAEPDIKVSNPAPAKQAKPKKEKKKGKGCLIAVLIAAAVLVLLFLLAAIISVVVILVAKKGNTVQNPYDYSNMEDYYGDYHGEATVMKTSGASELCDYLNDEGISAVEDDFLTDLEPSSFAFSLYETDDSLASWDMYVDLGDYMDYQTIMYTDFISWKDYEDENYFVGEIVPDENGAFHITVEDQDLSGRYASSFLGLSDDNTDGIVSLDFFGTIDSSTGELTGQLTVYIKYPEMDSTFAENILVTATKD